MISVIKLTEILSGDIDAIIPLLENAGITNISINELKQEIRFSKDIDSNPTSTVLYVDTLKYYSFSRAESGNIYTLLMDKKHMSFPSVLKWISQELGIAPSDVNSRRIHLPFGGFYKELISYQNTPPELNLPKYDLSILEPYSGKFNTLFFNDGISYQTQEYFNIGYDIISNRITIPEFDVNGNLVGIMGRINKLSKDINEFEARWLPVIPCSRGHLLYGYHFNYQSIQKKNMCFIGESEKFVMQLHSMGIYTGLALGTNSITDIQANYIKNLQVDKLIICFDEGVDMEQTIRMCKKIKSNNLVYKNQVGFIYDADNTLLPYGSKAAPSDFGYETFRKLLQDHIVWI